MVERRGYRGLVAKVTGQHQHPKPRVPVGGVLKNPQRSITAAIVDDQQFVRAARRLVEHREHTAQQLGKHLLLVVNRDRNGHTPVYHLGTPAK